MINHNQLRHVCIPEIPTAAWLCAIDRNCRNPILLHGPSVLVLNDAFIEGGWAGRYEDLDFMSSNFMTGSAGKAHHGIMDFRTASHSLEPLYSMKKSEIVLVSNSLAFLMAASGGQLRKNYLYYDRDIMTIYFGLDSYIKNLQLQDRSTVSLHYCANIKVTPNLSLEVNRNLSRPTFRDFREYKGHLLNVVGAILDNLGDERRPNKYRPLATVSTGYDSPAVASLAALSGCREAITFIRARDFLTAAPSAVSGPGFADNGTEIANILGLRTTEIDPDSYLGMDNFPEAEFLSTGYGGEDVVFAAAEPILRQRVLMTGYTGGRVWSLHPDHVSADLGRGDPSGASMLEFRLRTGFVHLPVPFIGAASHPSIWSISTSAEMRPWRMGGNYDKPVARRIAEEMGIDRCMFGQAKKAASRPFQSTARSNADIRQLMSPRSIADFQKFVRDHPRAGSIAERSIPAWLGFILNSRKVRKAASLWPPAKRMHKKIAWRHLKPIDWVSFTFPWALEKTVPRYEPSIRPEWLSGSADALACKSRSSPMPAGEAEP